MASATYEVPALAIALLPASQREQSKDYAAYTLEWSPLAVSAARTSAKFTIDSSVNFVALYVTGYVTDTAAPPVDVPAPMLTLGLKVADRDLFDRDVHWRNFAGSAIAPMPLPFPLYMPRATTLQGFLSNLSAATAVVARLTFHGFIIHDYGRDVSRAY